MWSAPALYALEGGNIGFQLGGQATDFVLLIMNPHGAASLMGSKVKLGAGEKQTITVEIDPKYLAIFDEVKNGWTLMPGAYTIMVGGSSEDLPLKAVVNLK